MHDHVTKWRIISLRHAYSSNIRGVYHSDTVLLLLLLYVCGCVNTVWVGSVFKNRKPLLMHTRPSILIYLLASAGETRARTIIHANSKRHSLYLCGVIHHTLWLVYGLYGAECEWMPLSLTDCVYIYIYIYRFVHEASIHVCVCICWRSSQQLYARLYQCQMAA